jgi:hypothetical protein
MRIVGRIGQRPDMRISAVADHQRHALADRNSGRRRRRRGNGRGGRRSSWRGTLSWRGGLLQQRKSDPRGRLIGLAAGVGSLAFQRRGVILLRALIVALRFMGEAALGVSRYQHAGRRRHHIDRRAGLGEADRLCGIGDGALEIALGAPDHGAVGERRGQRRIEPDRFVDVGERAVEITERLLRGTAVLVRIGPLGSALIAAS